MPRDHLSGMSRAPQLIGLPAASRPGARGSPVTYTLTASGSVVAPATASVVVIDVYTPGGRGCQLGGSGGGGGGFGRKTRLCTPGEVISVVIDQGLTVTGQYANRGSVSVDGMLGLGGQNGGDGAGGLGGTVTGADQSRSGGNGAPAASTGGAGGSAAGPGSNGNPGIGTTGGASPGGLAGRGGNASAVGSDYGGGGGGSNNTTFEYQSGGIGAAITTFL